MATKQGSLALLNDPVAQRLLRSTVPARFAYTWRDGTPRVVPIAFHWNGHEIVLGTPLDAPKVKALREGARVALTIDSDHPRSKCCACAARSTWTPSRGWRRSTRPRAGA
jgi:nitroimidazol reductase NimA-like FMN-containing flavoprotein (pyridoxamine 5'-phosphate oxidase superfamily)